CADTAVRVTSGNSLAISPAVAPSRSPRSLRIWRRVGSARAAKTASDSEFRCGSAIDTPSSVDAFAQKVKLAPRPGPVRNGADLRRNRTARGDGAHGHIRMRPEKPVRKGADLLKHECPQRDSNPCRRLERAVS